MKILLSVIVMLLAIGCSENEADYYEVENSTPRAITILNKIGFNKEVNLYPIGSRKTASEGDYIEIMTFEIPNLEGRKLLNYVGTSLVEDSSIGVWSVNSNSFSFHMHEMSSYEGHIYKLDYSLNTEVIILKDIKI